MTAIIDAHLDLAMNALNLNRDLTLPLRALNERDRLLQDHAMRGRAAVSLPELRRAGVRLACATVLARLRPESFPRGGYSRMDIDYCAPEMVFAFAAAQLAYYEGLAAAAEVRPIATRAELDAFWGGGAGGGGGARVSGGADDEVSPIGIILSMEGADPIVTPEAVGWWWERGLRVVSLVHYGQGPYAAGTGVEGGVTPEGRALLASLERKGMMLDVTHLADRAMEEALKSYGGPVLASHSNCRALVPGQRQLSDEQIAALVRRGAVIGLVCDAWMLYPGWVRGTTHPEVLSMDTLADHADHICQIAGSVDHVGIGSDLDGLYGTEQTPRDLKSIADLSRLGEILSRRGYSNEDIGAVMSGNWLRFFRANLPAGSASS